MSPLQAVLGYYTLSRLDTLSYFDPTAQEATFRVFDLDIRSFMALIIVPITLNLSCVIRSLTGTISDQIIADRLSAYQLTWLNINASCL